jgi:sirohydrochlorin ferrochelatase
MATTPSENWTKSELMAEIVRRLHPADEESSSEALDGPPVAPGGAPPALVAVAHGSRDPAALRTIRALLERVRELHPEIPVRLAHLGLNEPLLDDVLAGLGRGRAVLVPLLLGRGYHVTCDIPAAPARAPRLRARVAAPLGPHPLLAEALHARLDEAGWSSPEIREGRRAGRDAVVLAAAGSRARDSAADTAAQARLLAARLRVPVLPGYVSAAAPTVPQAVAVLRDRGYRRIAVAGYFTAPGDFSRIAAAAGDWLTSAPLGVHDSVARLVLERYADAAALPLPRAITHLVAR